MSISNLHELVNDSHGPIMRSLLWGLFVPVQPRYRNISNLRLGYRFSFVFYWQFVLYLHLKKYVEMI